MQRHRVHRPCPHQERIGRVRRALIAVAASLDDQAQPVVAREIDGGGNVGGAVRHHGERARVRPPRIQPARNLGAGRLVAQVERIAQALESIQA